MTVVVTFWLTFARKTDETGPAGKMADGFQALEVSHLISSMAGETALHAARFALTVSA
jgi:hypothetical protein